MQSGRRSVDVLETAASTKPAFDFLEREQKIRARTRRSWERFERSQRTLAGGCSSNLRRAARPYPLFFERGSGSRIIDVDGNSYLDYALGWGPLILGHAPREITDAIRRQVANGLTFGAQHDMEFEAAERLTSIIPCADQVCFANSGTEIVQVALRLARAVTGRQKLLKFEGHYHGWDDTVLVSYHPTREQMQSYDGAPVPVGVGQLPCTHTAIAQWNNRESVEAAFAANAGEISAILCEPLMCNSGCISPQPGFLQFLRDVSRKNGALLIFDEVITGFRLHLAGAQGFYGVTPDLATYGKAVGGGAAVSVLAGQSEFMDLIATGKVVHAGTLNGNPLSLAAVTVTLDALSAHGGAVYEHLWRVGERLRLGLERILKRAGFAVITSGGGPVFQVSFMQNAALNYRDLLNADTDLYGEFALALLDEGVMVLPDGRWYISAAHSKADIDATLAAAERIAAP